MTIREVIQRLANDEEILQAAIGILDEDNSELGIKSAISYLEEKKELIPTNLIPLFIDAVRFGIHSGMSLGLAWAKEEYAGETTAN